ncbi:UDP-3-O-(3-hydroxymyristoyl)glucosamine N-acyltransferase [Geothermobacter hydrogeniphilus]|uniref:UDP-3-O-acylglucosamine N-acyltransferase n=1 Tax=Geothermobacter hydrogeniphilus TaxID=1969733 RepID=A0A1X0Y1U7_9BACT|nr:UDP-3-O-(3-hydroxymyristoyl)glucosamine N-acyltransferase [Geothermobacter hydrogeniphilus]ORJ59054.1 UDP-3-O-(3-hydroxymyristoyl)glucosamine N-acyltransferase [Geothermobacter hydrogeniphilus]
MPCLQELADLVGGRVVGDPQLKINRLTTFEEAEPGDIVFVTRAGYASRLGETRASAVILDEERENLPLAQLVCPNPYLAFARVLQCLQPANPAPLGIMPGAFVDPEASVGENVSIHPGCHVGRGVRIGRGTVLHPNVVIYPGATIGDDCLIQAGCVVREDCRIGNRVILQPNAVIGSDGFGFAPDGERYEKIPQVGIVVIEDDVEIGACACVDRAALGVTRIGTGCKLDNQVQIGHNVDLGPHTVMAAQSGVSGSTVIGRHCTFGGQSGTAGHIRIGDNVTVAGRGGVTSHTEGDQVISGAPAIPHREWLKMSMILPKLPEMKKEISRLKRQVDELKALLKES